VSLSDDILAATKKVTKEWTRQRKAEERGSRSRAFRPYVYSDRVCFTDVANQILPAAYKHASGDGYYSVSKRQLYYACREAFKQKTGRPLEYGYFADTLLVQYMNRHPNLGWKITADPRGTLTIPNSRSDVRIPVGTIQIDNHMREAARACDPYGDVKKMSVRAEWPSLAAGQRYQAVLYIEKEGFGPILEEAEIAERYDLAILSCKGQSVVAARRFIDEVCAVGRDVPLLVFHDFDKAGFEIAQRLTTVSGWAEENDRVTYRFRNDIKVIDLGLRLADVEAYGLKGESCEFRGHFAADSIATPEEQEFLRSGRRVEMNEFTSPQIVECLEAKFDEHLPGRLIPGDDVLADAYRRALAAASINRAIDKVRDKAIDRAKAAAVPESLRRRLKKRMKASDEPGDQVLYELVAERKSKLSQEGDG
jgi:hypothetical protein